MATDKVKRSIPSAQTQRRRLNPQWKFQAYDLLNDLNRGFHIALASIDRMKRLGRFRRDYLPVFRGLAGEAQAAINHHFLEILQEVEKNDWYRFGKIRSARKKHLKTQLPKPRG